MSAPRIMVVEDDETIRDVVCGFLEDAGYETLRAPDGAVALSMLHTERPPSLILLDWMMPNVSGSEFLEVRRSLPPVLRAIPVLILSASLTGSTMAGIREQLPVLRKPFDADVLLALVASLAQGAGVPEPTRSMLEPEIERLEALLPRVAGVDERAVGHALHAARNRLTRIDLAEQMARRRAASDR